MGITNVPNEGAFKTRDGREKNSYMPLARGASPVHPPNNVAGDRKGGSASLAGMASPINPPNNVTFDDGDRGMTPMVGSAVEPGKGSVPVNPFLSSGGIVPARVIADEATERLAKR
jgi:hypothetical protein